MEQRALGVSGTSQEEGSRRQVHDLPDAELALDDFESRYPHAGGLVVLGGLLLVVASQGALVVLARLLAVAVVPLVVQHPDILHSHETGHDALDHLPLGLQRLQLVPSALE